MCEIQIFFILVNLLVEIDRFAVLLYSNLYSLKAVLYLFRKFIFFFTCHGKLQRNYGGWRFI